MALITSDCGTTRSLSIKFPNHLGLRALQVGHDLSCVSDIICMEPIPQQDAWEQLISRAYRMGADIATTITVRTLAMMGGGELHVLEQCPWADALIPSAKQAARQLFPGDPLQKPADSARKRPRLPARAAASSSAAGLRTHPMQPVTSSVPERVLEMDEASEEPGAATVAGTAATRAPSPPPTPPQPWRVRVQLPDTRHVWVSIVSSSTIHGLAEKIQRQYQLPPVTKLTDGGSELLNFVDPVKVALPNGAGTVMVHCQ